MCNKRPNWSSVNSSFRLILLLFIQSLCTRIITLSIQLSYWQLSTYTRVSFEAVDRSCLLINYMKKKIIEKTKKKKHLKHIHVCRNDENQIFYHNPQPQNRKMIKNRIIIKKITHHSWIHPVPRDFQNSEYLEANGEFHCHSNRAFVTSVAEKNSEIKKNDNKCL